MKFIFKLSCFLLFVLFSQRSNAQEVWDWQKCIEYALQNNIQVKQSDLSIQLGEVALKQQKLNYSPTINASSNYNLHVGNTYNFYTNEYARELVHYHDYSLNFNQPIFDGLVIVNSVKKSKFDLQALQLDQESLKSSIQLQILTAFLNIMNANEQYRQQLNQKTITQQQHDHTQELINAGAAAEKALLDIDAQLTSEDLTISQIKNQRDLAYLALKMILELDVKKDIEIKVPELPQQLSIDSLENINKIYSDALSLRPEIKSAKARIASADKAVSVAKGANYPTLSFVAYATTFFTSQSKNYTQVQTGSDTIRGFIQNPFQEVVVPIPTFSTQQSKNPYIHQLNQNLSYVLGLSLNIPIYNHYQSQSGVKESRLRYQQALFTESQAELDLYNTIAQAYLKAQAAIESYKAAERNFETTTKSYDYAVERLDAGSIDQLEVNIAKSNVETSQSKLTQAKYEYLFNTKVLDFYQGKKITLE